MECPGCGKVIPHEAARCDNCYMPFTDNRPAIDPYPEAPDQPAATAAPPALFQGPAMLVDVAPPRPITPWRLVRASLLYLGAAVAIGLLVFGGYKLWSGGNNGFASKHSPLSFSYPASWAKLDNSSFSWLASLAGVEQEMRGNLEVVVADRGNDPAQVLMVFSKPGYTPEQFAEKRKQLESTLMGEKPFTMPGGVTVSAADAWSRGVAGAQGISYSLEAATAPNAAMGVYGSLSYRDGRAYMFVLLQRDPSVVPSASALESVLDSVKFTSKQPKGQ